MPRMNGFEFLEAFRVDSPDGRTIIIVVSAFDDALLAKLSPFDVHAVVRKPFDIPSLVALVLDLAVAWSAHQRVAAPEPVRDFDASAEARP